VQWNPESSAYLSKSGYLDCQISCRHCSVGLVDCHCTNNIRAHRSFSSLGCPRCPVQFPTLIIAEAAIIEPKTEIPFGPKMTKQDSTLSEIMTAKVISVDISERVEEALRLMIKFDVGSVIVTDKQRPVGIITERDITRASLRGDSLLRIPVRGLMSKPVQSVSPDTEIWRAFETMLKLGVRRLPVVGGDGKLIGMVTEIGRAHV
jgi:CBS domain-containing protein